MTRLAGCGVCLIGPGLGRGNGVAAVVRHLLGEIHLPVVLDADGINALEGHIDVLDSRRGLHTVLTPTTGSLSGWGASCRRATAWAARAFAVYHACCLVLKGHRTITAFPTARPTSTPTAIRAWPRGGAATCWQG